MSLLPLLIIVTQMSNVNNQLPRFVGLTDPVVDVFSLTEKAPVTILWSGGNRQTNENTDTALNISLAVGLRLSYHCWLQDFMLMCLVFAGTPTLEYDPTPNLIQTQRTNAQYPAHTIPPIVCGRYLILCVLMMGEFEKAQTRNHSKYSTLHREKHHPCFSARTWVHLSGFTLSRHDDKALPVNHANSTII